MHAHCAAIASYLYLKRNTTERRRYKYGTKEARKGMLVLIMS